MEPSIATSSSQLLQAQVEGKADTRIHLATHGHQDLGSFVKAVLSQKGVVELQIDCSCHSAGIATFEVMLLFEGSTVFTPSFAFRKSCRSDLIPGLNVGTAPHGSNAVKNGEARWLQTPESMPRVNSSQSTIDLYVTSSYAGSDALAATGRIFQSPLVRTLGDAGVVEAQVESTLGQDHGMLDFGHPQLIKISFRCLKSALGIVDLTLIPQHPWDPFRPVSIALEKDCRESHKPALKVGTLQSRARVRHLLDMPPILVKSSFAESTSVYSDGRTLPAWEVSNPSVSLAPENNVVVFTIVTNSAVPASSKLLLSAPKMDVSNSRVLEVVMSQETEDGNFGKPASFLGIAGSEFSPLVFIARHICKDLGFSKVVVTLPIHMATSGELPVPIKFSYWKTCHRPVKSLASQFVELQTFSQWDVPAGGWRTFMIFFIVLVFLVLAHEFGHVYLSRRMKHSFETSYGPALFGVKCTVGSLTFKPWSGAFLLEDLTLMNPPGYTGEILMRAHKITILVAVRKAVFSLGHVSEIRVMQLKHVDVHIELDDITDPFSGGSNLQVVGDHGKRYLEEQQEHEKRLKEQGVKPGAISQAATERVTDVLQSLSLLEVELEDIQCTCSFVSYPSVGGAELNIEDIHFHNFSEEFDVYGASAIMGQLGEVVKQAVSNNFLGNTGNKMARKVSRAKTTMVAKSRLSEKPRRGR
jgi:hypothetical protein